MTPLTLILFLLAVASTLVDPPFTGSSVVSVIIETSVGVTEVCDDVKAPR